MIAGSRISTRFVAAITITPSFTPNPSISTRSWFSVCSLSSCPPPMPVPRCLATASISSINTIQGSCFLASLNRSLTRDAPTPTYISTKSEPEIEKNGTPASPAIAFASSVLPVPGGPSSRTPFGILAPTSINLPGFFKNWTISCRSSFSSFRPATPSKVTLSSPSDNLARLFPKFAIFPAPPPLFIMEITTMTTSILTPSGRITVVRIPSPSALFITGYILYSFSISSAFATSVT